MQRFYIKEINFGNSQVLLNDGMNIILGPNGSGKTTLFDLIQYTIGLKKNLSNNSLVDYNDFYVECIFDSKTIRFHRPIKSTAIYITGDLNLEIKAGTTELIELYNFLLSPHFEFDDDKTAGYQILKSSFLPQLNLSYGIIDIKTIKKILGLNISYLDETKKQIEYLRNQAKLNDSSFALLQQYIANISEVLTKDKPFEETVIQEVIKMLGYEYQKLYHPIANNLSLLHKSTEAYDSLKILMDQSFNDKISLLESTFYNYSKELGIYNNDDLSLFLNTKTLMSPSSSKILLLNFVFILSLITNREKLQLNSSLFLAVDSLFDSVSYDSAPALRKLITRECCNSGLQYIEFTRRLTEGISPEWTIHELDCMRGLK